MMLRHTWIYGVGQVLRGLSSLILLPLYTTHLRPADFGLVELASVVIDLATLLFGGRLGIGLFKYYEEAGTAHGRRTVISTALVSAFFTNLFAIACLWLASSTLTAWADAPQGFESALRILALALVFNAVNEVFFAYLRLEDRPIAYVVASFVKFASQLALSIWLIAGLGLGYWGIVVATLVSSAALTLYFAIRLLPHIGIAFDRVWAVKLLTFSLPIVLSALGMYYVTLGNRYFLNLYHGLAAVGIYALAYKFALTYLSLVWAPFATFWNTKQFAYAREPQAPKLFGTLFLYLNFILLPAAVGMTVLAPHFLQAFTSPEYASAAALVPWVVGTALLQCWTDYLRFGIFHAGKTLHLAYGTFATAALVTALYWWWIPPAGALGAAKATFAAFCFRLVYFAIVGRRFFRIEVPWSRVAALAGAFLAIYAVLVKWLMSDGLALLVKPLVIAAATALLASTPLVLPRHRRVALGWLLRRPA